MASWGLQQVPLQGWASRWALRVGDGGDTQNVPSLRAASRQSLGDQTWIWFRQVCLNSLPCGLCKLTELTPWHQASAEGFSFHCYFVFSARSWLVSIDQAFDLLMAVLVGDRALDTARVFSESHGPSCICPSMRNGWEVHEEEAGN